jgi:hypothetical protein
MLNIENKKITTNNLAKEIIQNIKLQGASFKNLIRNFSQKITYLRDSYLSKYKIDINDWVVGNYTEDVLNAIEKDVFKQL